MTITPDGRIPQSGFETYRLPQAGDAVAVQIDLYEGAPSLGLGAKGAGKIPILNVAAAVQQIPLTPPRVLDLLCGEGEALEFSHIAEEWRGNVLGGQREDKAS